MTFSPKQTTLLLAALAAGMAICLPAGAEPPPWAPAHGYRAKMERETREYRYTYYPAQQVYYAPETQTWFWLNGGTWQFGLNLPGSIHISAGVPVTLATNMPYTQHVYVEEHYGRPWREKHRHEHGRDDDHDDDRDHGHDHDRRGHRRD